MAKWKVLAIVGPTCTGKTALSLAVAKKFPAEIICCDSRNVYKYFDLGSAKPSMAEREALPHHLIDLAEPDQEFTAGQFAKLASVAIEDISTRNKLPVLCGGTGFYAKALLQGLSIPPIGPQNQLREEMRIEESKNPGILHEKLKKLDPSTASRLNPRDIFRITRALEVCIVSGKTFSDLAGSKESPYDVLWIGLTIKNREKLKELIKVRLKEQMASGMLDEVEKLYSKYGENQKLINTVNYRDLIKYIKGEYSMERAMEEAERHNFQLARRQMMWFKSNPEIKWFHVDELSREKVELDVIEMTEAFFFSC